jgi:two-component system, OmpR family, sensor kinase
MLDSVRLRLTFWYTGVLALVLILFSVGVYGLLARQLHRRLEGSLHTTLEGTARLLTLERLEGESEREAAHSALTEQYFPHQAVAIFDEKEQLLAEHTPPGSAPARLLVPWPQASTLPLFFTATEKQATATDAARVTMQRVVVVSPDTPYIIAVSQSLETVTEELELLWHIFAGAVPLALMVAGIGGWFLARKSLAPVVEMSDTAQRISVEHLAQRLPIANPSDELGQLAATFNALLARLEASFAQQRQFMADASHELRTPLAVMHTTADVTLQQPYREESEYREALAIIGQQTQRLTRLVVEMFTLAHADAGGRPLHLQAFYLDELLAETARAAHVLAARKNVAITTAFVPEALCYGDEELLRQMILNLLDNAITHTPPDGQVQMTLALQDGQYRITVTDTGGGIPADAQAHIFERFYRADKARSHTATGHGSGAGLGLAIARWIAQAHNGALTLAHSDSTGSIFVAALPAPALR